MLKGSKRNFVVVVVLLGGVESWAKNVFQNPNGTKNMQGQKMFQMAQKMFANKKFAKSKRNKNVLVEKKILLN